jgi:hypothetical protein
MVSPRVDIHTYGPAEQFLHEQLLPSYIRKQGQQARWCKHWYLHAEAISRVTAMWRSWEKLRLEAGTGASDWWLHHADPHMKSYLAPKQVRSTTATTNTQHRDRSTLRLRQQASFPTNG